MMLDRMEAAKKHFSFQAGMWRLQKNTLASKLV